MAKDLTGANAAEIARAVATGEMSAASVVDAAIGQQTFTLDGVELPVRPNMGIFTQPLSFIGLPVVAVPVALKLMPIGVQIISAPSREDVALRIAYALEKMGAAEAPRPNI